MLFIIQLAEISFSLKMSVDNFSKWLKKKGLLEKDTLAIQGNPIIPKLLSLLDPDIHWAKIAN